MPEELGCIGQIPVAPVQGINPANLSAEVTMNTGPKRYKLLPSQSHTILVHESEPLIITIFNGGRFQNAKAFQFGLFEVTPQTFELQSVASFGERGALYSTEVIGTDCHSTLES